MMATRHTFPGSAQNFNGAQEQQNPEGMLGQVRAAGEAVQSQAEHAITDYPITTVLAVFGIGLGVGVVLGSTMFASPSSSSAWFPSASSHSSSWMPAMGSNGSWFSGQAPSNWSDSLMRNAKSMCGY
jgi:hypothetical protein